MTLLVAALLVSVLSIVVKGHKWFQYTSTQPSDLFVTGVQETIDYQSLLYTEDFVLRQQENLTHYIREEAYEDTDGAFIHAYVDKGLASHDYGLLDKEELLQIRRLEQSFLSNTNFEQYCKSQAWQNLSCHSTDSFLSIMEIFEDKGANLKNMTQQEIILAWNQTLADPVKWQRLKPLFSANVTYHGHTSKIYHLKTIMKVGLPLHINEERYKNNFDRYLEQRDHIFEFY